jgi:hypothetical protein
MRCYCSICRKTGGAGGYAINLAAHSKTLQVTCITLQLLDQPAQINTSTCMVQEPCFAKCFVDHADALGRQLYKALCNTQVFPVRNIVGETWHGTVRVGPVLVSASKLTTDTTQQHDTPQCLLALCTA